jgi:hypothetical protein
MYFVANLHNEKFNCDGFYAIKSDELNNVYYHLAKRSSIEGEKKLIEKGTPGEREIDLLDITAKTVIDVQVYGDSKNEDFSYLSRYSPNFRNFNFILMLDKHFVGGIPS